ncbi:hypothetical protein STENM327S_05397 [Streptomyces tendae]
MYLTGLTIAGYTYGALLGAFLLGRLVKRAGEADSVVAFLVTIGVMTNIVREVKIDVTTGGTTVSQAIAAQWLGPIGVLITLLVGGVLSLFHRAPEAAEGAAVDEEPGGGPDQLTTTAGRNWNPAPARSTPRRSEHRACDRPDVRHVLRRHRGGRRRPRTTR